MIPGFHGLDLIVILVVALLIFGPKRLPEMGASIGKSIKEFRKGMAELTSPKEAKEEEPPAVSLEAIDREVAAKRASTSGATVVENTTEYSSTETPVE